MKKYIITIVSIFLLFITPVSAKEKVKLSKCIDGDTIKVFLNKEEITVRLLAIDTPEIKKEDNPGEYYGAEAAEYTCNKVKNAKKIELEYDKKSDKEDKYGRTLAWVFIDNELLEALLVENGYAKVAYLYKEYKYADILKEKQELASAKEIGIWDSEAEKNYNPDKEEETKNENEELENSEIIVLVAIFLLITFISKIFAKK